MNQTFMTRPDEALAVHESIYGHNSTFVSLDDGRILQVCLGGAMVHSDDGGITWSQPGGEDIRNAYGSMFRCQFRDTNGDPVGGSECSLVKLSEKDAIGLAARVPDVIEGQTYATLPAQSKFVFWRSNDAGETWQPPVRMTAPGYNTGSYQDVFLRTSSGRIVLSVYHFLGQSNPWKDMICEPMTGRLINDQQWMPTAGHFFDSRFTCVYVLYSDDDGRTWQRNKDGELTILLDWNGLFSYGNECSVTEVVPGRLLLMMRNGLGRLFQAWSNDNGESWTKPQPTPLASPTCPAQIRTLPNGHLLCVWNQEGEQEIRRGLIRVRVSTAISRDGGRVWEFFQNLISYNEVTRVEPGPVGPTRPAEMYMPAGQPAFERDPALIVGETVNHRASYPSCHVLKDRVIVTHTYSEYELDPVNATLIGSAKAGGPNQHQKVLPLTWFYGGKEPADNPFLKTAYEPAKP